jgi:hypothetical protein
MALQIKRALAGGMLLASSIFTPSYTMAQADTLAFTLPHGLLELRGRVNGVEVPMVFDTGAGLSVSNDSVNAWARNRPVKSGIIVRDANNQRVSTPMVLMKTTEVGQYRKKGLKVISYNMPFLTCYSSLLLGVDFMADYNWKIDFDAAHVVISRQAILPGEAAEQLEVRFERKLPYMKMQLQSQEASWWLIDFGYRGYVDVPLEQHAGIQYTQDYPKYKFTTTQMGLVSTTEDAWVLKTQLDTLRVGNSVLHGVPADLDSTASPKIGLHFLKSFCHWISFNYSTGEVWVKWRQQPALSLQAANASPDWRVCKLVLGSYHTAIMDTATSKDMTLLSVNGLKAADFSDACSLLRWRMQAGNEPKTMVMSSGRVIQVSNIPYAAPRLQRAGQ